MRMRSMVAVCVLAAVVAAARIGAIEQRPMPVFRVVGANGASVSSAELGARDRWLLVYVAPGCRSCDRLLGALERWQSTQLLERTVIVVGGPADAAQQYIDTTLPAPIRSIAWYADAGGEAWQALRLNGTPVLVGVDKSTITWAISGVLNDPTALESVVRTWVAR